MAEPIYMESKEHGIHIVYTSKEEQEAQKHGFKRVDINKVIADKIKLKKAEKNAN